MRGFVVAALLALTCGGVAAAAPDAHAVVRASMAAMGGAARLRSITAVDYLAVGERDMVEQSERPTGPYYLDHFRIHEVRDIAGRRTHVDRSDEGYAAGLWWLQQTPADTSSVVIDDGVAGAPSGATFTPAGNSLGQFDQEQYALAPERLLLTADAASDLRALPDVVAHDVPMHVLAFTWRGVPVTLQIDAESDLPWQVGFVRAYPHSIFLNAWGDVQTSITYNAWTLEPFGIRYPREWTYERVGLPDQHLQILTLHFNPTLAATQLDLPAAFLKANAPYDIDGLALGAGGDGPVHALAPGITLYPGAWNVAYVEQSDGIVVIEAPISSNYAKAVFAYARDVLHGHVKAVITTSDSWPHIAGVRQAVAEGIPVYALDRNVAILQRLLAAPHTLRPDDLQRAPRAPDFRTVAGPTEVGTGANRLTILPYRTATGERQMMVWFPQSSLLYTSDLFAPNGDDGWFTPEYLKEAMEAVARYKIAPTSVWGMHYGLTPWSSIVEVVTHFAPQ